MPEKGVYVGRPSPWANRHRVGLCPVCGVEHTQQEAVDEYRAEVVNHPLLREILDPLRGATLVCWCGLDKPCHADVLIEFLDRQEAKP